MKSSRILFQIILTILIFSLWAAFALFIVNPYLKNDLPGYVVGKICIWEFIAFIISAVIAHFLIKKWGPIQIQRSNEDSKLILNTKYAYFFLLYLLIAIVIAVWQFWMFSQNY